MKSENRNPTQHGRSVVLAIRVFLTVATFIAGHGFAIHLAWPELTGLWQTLPTWGKVLYCVPPLGPIGFFGYAVGKALLWNVILVIAVTFAVSLMLLPLSPNRNH